MKLALTLIHQRKAAPGNLETKLYKSLLRVRRAAESPAERYKDRDMRPLAHFGSFDREDSFKGPY